MGSVSTGARTDVLVIKWRDTADRPRQTTTIQRTAEANAFCRRKYREWPGPRTADTGYTVAELVAEYVETRERDHADTGKPGASALAGDRVALTRIAGRWPHTPVDDLTRPEVAKWFSDMRREGRKDHTVRIYASTLRSAYRWGINAQTVALAIPPVPTVHVNNAEGGQAIEPEQLRAMADAIHEHYRPMFLTLAFTGMRIGEVCALNVSSYRKGHLVGGSKTTAGKNRPVAVPDWLAHILDAHTEHRAPDEPLFVNRRGDRIKSRPWRRRVWDPAAETAGIPEATPHWLRHTLATRLAEQGHGGWEMRSHFGWADQRIADHYIKTAQTGIRSIADTLEQYRPPLRAVE